MKGALFLQTILRSSEFIHGTETRICTSLQKRYIICIKQYVHVFSLWFFVQQ